MNGLILVGGESSRLGFDKMTILRDNIPIYQWWVNNLKSFCSNVFISCNDQLQKKYQLQSCILDTTPNTGPLGGIVSFINKDSSLPIFVTAVDLCYVQLEDIENIFNSRNSEKFSTAYLTGLNIFPLFTILEKKIFPKLIEEYQTERKSLKIVLQSYPVEILTKEINLNGINTKEEYLNYLNKNQD
ncbi:MAG: NTP transferase domain-containing protein [Saprospiraceae bacterium]